MALPSTSSTLRATVIALAALVAAVPAAQLMASPASWIGAKVQGNGVIEKQRRDTGHFTGLSLGLPGSVELRIGATEGVTIETDQNLLPLIETVVENGALKIRPAGKNMKLATRHMKIVVTARSIDRIALGGSGSIESDALRAPKLQFDVGGSGSLNVKSIESESVAVTIGGSGNFKSAGSTGKLSLSIGGSGDAELARLAANSVSATIAGSGQATVWAKQSLSATIAGSGDIDYYGDPKLSRTIAGSGDVTRIGSAP